jgi:hypothetical protein
MVPSDISRYGRAPAYKPFPTISSSKGLGRKPCGNSATLSRFPLASVLHPAFGKAYRRSAGLRDETPYNPLDKIHLGESVANAILQRPVEPLPPPDVFLGAGVYAIYYTGDFPAYRRIAERNRDSKFDWPIYVGKAIPAGARRGGLGLTIAPSRALFNRLAEHAQSVREATNLRIEDFHCRYLVVDDIWIPLGESLLIQRFAPAWNTTLDGYGNHDPGSGRYNQQRSPWDVIHPGRVWAARCQANARTEAEILGALQAAIDAIP